MKYPIEKMRACLDLLPPPGGEVVAECLDEIESLRQQLAESDAEVAAWRSQAHRSQSDADRLEAECDQLRQQLAEANRKIEYEQLCASELEQQLDQLRQQLTAVSDLLKEASGPMSYGNWSNEFRDSVEKALTTQPKET